VAKRDAWMPVFVVVPARVTLHAASADFKGRVPKEPTVEGADFEQRIGTAYRQKDGGFVVQLTAVPVNGQLRIRPRRAGEHLDPTQKGS